MPTVLRTNGFRFFFYSNESDEPVHIHVEKAASEGKIWLEPLIKIAYLHGFSPAEEQKIMEIVEKKVVTFKENWNEHFA